MPTLPGVVPVLRCTVLALSHRAQAPLCVAPCTQKCPLGRDMELPDPIPFFFGAAGSELFGWMHDAPTGSQSRFGLVVCNPFGFDEICAHRSIRHLAAAAAASGVPTLRFDYAGSGNSCGDEFEPGRLNAWKASIHQAIDQLKAASGLEHVCLVGVRLGATLATLAAVERDDVVGLVTVAPVVKGRDYVRELRILGQTTATESSQARAGDDFLESAGFVLTRDTVEVLQGVNLRQLTKAPARHVVIVERDDVPSPTEWPQDLARLGSAVQVETWPGYGAIMTSPQDAVVPQLMIQEIVAVLTRWQSSPRTVAGGHASLGAASINIEGTWSGRSTTVSETLARIDTGTSTLFGILTTPSGFDAGDERGGRPSVVMLNSGAVHHIGPNRLWVTLARYWAARGLTTLRLDLSGIGDSAARPGQPENIDYSAEASRDIADALTWLRGQQDVGSCHLLGLCSGAFHALKAAAAGHPMNSALIINPLTYSWADCARLGKELNDYEILEQSTKYRKQILTLEPWVRLVRGQLDLGTIRGVVTRRLRDSWAQSLSRLRRVFGGPPENVLSAELMAAIQCQIQLRFVFTVGDPGYDLLRRQTGRAFDRLSQQGELSIDFVADANHTFTQLDSRERLIALLDTLMPSVRGHARSSPDRTSMAESAGV